MKKVINNPHVQTLISVLIVFAAYIVSTLQGVFGILFPFVLLGFFILTIVFVYYIVTIPLLERLRPKSCDSTRTYSMDRLIKYEMTENFKEIWVITSNLQLAYDKSQFGAVIHTNIDRGVEYKFFINDNCIAKERASEMMNLYKDSNGRFKIYLIPNDLPFVDQNTDYDLFFLNDSSDNMGFIGITLDGVREYVRMSQELFLKLKMYIVNLNLNNIM